MAVMAKCSPWREAEPRGVRSVGLGPWLSSAMTLRAYLMHSN